ncbi:MAG: hypothetical protein M1358_02545 [Chloroflexi bacterium]|nr:hypothetical protein [Chloroflexota bacterium]
MNVSDKEPTLNRLNEELQNEMGELKRISKKRRSVLILFLIAIPFAMRAYGLIEGLVLMFVVAIFFLFLDYWLSRSHRWRIRRLRSEMKNTELS